MKTAEPCPFCGEPERLQLRHYTSLDGTRHGWRVSCYACNADGPLRRGPADSAREAWNTRPRVDGARAEGERNAAANCNLLLEIQRRDSLAEGEARGRVAGRIEGLHEALMINGDWDDTASADICIRQLIAEADAAPPAKEPGR